MEERYQQLQESAHGDHDTDTDELGSRMDDLEARLEACNTRLESKMDESHKKLEAMIRELLTTKTSNVAALAPPSVEPSQLPPPVSVQISSVDVADTNLNKETSPTPNASGVTNRSGQDDPDIGTTEDVVAGQSVEHPEEEGSKEGTGAPEKSPVAATVEDVQEDNVYALLDAPLPAAQSDQADHSGQVKAA